MSYLSCLAKVQRLACLGVTGAPRSTPQAALEVMLDIQPLDIFVKGAAVKTALRLRELQELGHRALGHCAILTLFSGAQLNRDTDYMAPVANFVRTFCVDVPTREDWAADRVIRDDEISVFTDGSKTETGTGSGIFSADLGIRISERLSPDCSVFQAEIYAVDRAAQMIREQDLNPTAIRICVDSLAALKALEADTIRSDCVRGCIESLTQIGRHSITLTWVPGHEGVRGNELADECAREGSGLQVGPLAGVRAPLVALFGAVDAVSRGEMRARWVSLSDCRISRTLWPLPDPGRTKILLGFGKRTVGMLIGILTGHCAIGRMAVRWGYSREDYCRSCGDEEEESVQHMLCDCPGLKERRLKCLGRRFFDDLDSLGNVSLRRLADF